jgi:hypothetical protein
MDGTDDSFTVALVCKYDGAVREVTVYEPSDTFYCYKCGMRLHETLIKDE